MGAGSYNPCWIPRWTLGTMPERQKVYLTVAAGDRLHQFFLFQPDWHMPSLPSPKDNPHWAPAVRTIQLLKALDAEWRRAWTRLTTGSQENT